MAKELKGKRIAALVTKGFEQVELVDPKKALERGCSRAQDDVVSVARNRSSQRGRRLGR